MNQSSQQPMPTPFDIADIPFFKKPLYLEWWPYAVLLCVILYGIWLFKNRDPRKIARKITTILLSDLDAGLKQSSLTRGDFAILWKKCRRAFPETGDTFLAEASKISEELLYGPVFNEGQARDILAQCAAIAKEDRCRQ